MHDICTKKSVHYRYQEMKFIAEKKKCLHSTWEERIYEGQIIMLNMLILNAGSRRKRKREEKRK